MRLLYFAPHQIWPVNTGARLRDYNLSMHLAARCSVTFAEMRNAREQWRKPPVPSGFVGLVTLDKRRTYSPSRILRGLAGPIPLTVLNCWSRQMAGELASSLRPCQFDSAQIEGVHLMEYLPIITETLGSRAIVVDWHNVESELMWRYAETKINYLKKLAARRTARLLESAEDRLLDLCDTHTVTSEHDRRKLLLRRPNANIRIIPNGVDANHYSSQELIESSRRVGPTHSRRSILFVGSMDFHANIEAVNWFARTVWPEIARNYPEIDFTIVGRDPPLGVRSLASDRIHVTGTVADVRPFYSSAIVAVVPLRSGSGTRLKILEAMAAGVPVVSTRLGAEGIDIEDNVHFLLADSEREIAAAISRTLSSAEMRNRLTSAARALVVARYDWSVIGEQLYRIHYELVQATQSRPLRNGS